MSTFTYSILADIVLIFHFLIIVFAITSQIFILVGWKLNWYWIRNIYFRLAHLLLVIIVAIQSFQGILCPFTRWEYSLRRLANQHFDFEISLMARILQKIVFYKLPAWAFVIIYTFFGLLVLFSFILIPPSLKKKQIISSIKK